MDLKLIQRLMAMMKRGGIAELDVEDPASGLKLRLRREEAPAPAPGPPLVHLFGGGMLPQAAAAPAAALAEAAAPAPAAPAAPAGKPFASPMVGTFYRSASPEAEPFVQVGTRVQPDTVLCIIEAMKVMNEIRAEVSGEIAAVLVENGEPVEFGQPLFLLRP
jgi:acetyl-CoA carboxylase biotin carboxyl carrier protein